MPGIPCIDLFCGAGGFSAGFRKAGFRIASAVESVEVFARTHHENFPESKTVRENIRSLPPDKFADLTGLSSGSVPVIIGSPPCQTFSTIGIPKINSLGNGGVKTDPRNYLFREYFDYVDFYQPDAFVLENVPSMRSRFKGQLFQHLLELIEELGYRPHVAILNSAHFGVPQVRRRLFVVGTLPGIEFSFPEPTHVLEDEIEQLSLITLDEQPRPRTPTVFDAIGDLPLIRDGNRVDELPYSRSSHLSTYQLAMRNSDGRVRTNTCRVSNERAKRVFPYMAQGSKYMDLPEEVRKILPFREDIFQDRLKRLDMGKPSWTVLAHIGMDGYMYIHPTENRTLSVREAARIQSFHDSFVLLGNMREQYVQVGNAVPPLVAEAVARSVKSAIAGVRV